ncbi:MAG: phosphoenolpyruvate--protein phosphotransferase [Desulfuromonadales bacterium]
MVLEKTNIPFDTYLVGIGVSPGVAIGETFLVNRARTSVVERCIYPQEVETEVARFEAAVELSRQQLEDVRERVTNEQMREHIYIIDTHLLILQDQMLIDDTIQIIRDELYGAEGALARVLEKFRAVFNTIEDEYLRERRSDIDSVGERLLRNLTGADHYNLSDIDRKVVIVAHDLSPADTMQIDKEKIHGFMTDVGGRTSHTAILARSMGIPAILGLETISQMVPGGVPVIIDGTAGTVVLNPSEETFKEYLTKKQAFEYIERELLSYRDLPCETLDGRHIALRGNVELSKDVDVLLEQRAEGVGLFRTEFLYMNRQSPPTEDEQFETYRRTVERVAPHPTTIRTLDLGGDKFIKEIDLADEANPAMGLRAVRFSIKEVRLFKIQLRAILRASVFGRARIMFPMVSGLAELRQCRELLDEAKSELRAEGIGFNPDIEVGVMIETPSAAVIADLLAREVDFFSIGTNDLIQYALAVDRGNEHVAYLYEPLHPAVLRLLKMVCDAARANGIGVSICGEMAAEPIYGMILMGLGFTELSMNPHCVLRVKRVLRQITCAESEAFLSEIMAMTTALEIVCRLEEEMGTRFPELFGTMSI